MHMQSLFSFSRVFSRGSCLLIFAGIACSCSNEPAESTHEEPSGLSADYYADYPHDTLAFTEGFLIHEGLLYESTGSPSDVPQAVSQIGIVDLITGSIDTKVQLDDQYFGEGIAILNDRVFQLTYRARKGFVYDLATFELQDEFTLPGAEGWGMTADSTYLIMSDGTDQLTYLDPLSYEVVRTLSVTREGAPQEDLNELEYIGGFIYANIWLTNRVVKIDPSTGVIVGSLDLTPYAREASSLHPGAKEMNGIAYNESTGRVLITGKMWPRIYELSISPL